MTETPKKPRRWLYPVLFLSLALNLLIAGIVVGWLASPDGPRQPDFGSARGLVGEAFLRALPRDHRREFIKDVAHETPRIRESRDDLRARFQAFLTELRTEPYDPAAVAALLQEQRGVALSRQDIGERLLLIRLEEMSPEERAKYADALERSFRRLRQPQN